MKKIGSRSVVALLTYNLNQSTQQQLQELHHKSHNSTVNTTQYNKYIQIKIPIMSEEEEAPAAVAETEVAEMSVLDALKEVRIVWLFVLFLGSQSILLVASCCMFFFLWWSRMSCW